MWFGVDAAYRALRRIELRIPKSASSSLQLANDTVAAEKKAPMTSSLSAIPRTAPRFAKPFLQCSQCPCLPRVLTRPNIFNEAFSKPTKAFKTSSRRASSATVNTFASPSGLSSPLSVLGKSIGQTAGKTRPGFFPTISEKSVAYWLLGSAASVFGIVVFGGLTRLTESGYFIIVRNS